MAAVDVGRLITSLRVDESNWVLVMYIGVVDVGAMVGTESKTVFVSNGISTVPVWLIRDTVRE